MDICKDYRVFINGAEVQTQTARVSAVPFNRRWPGHQRTTDQTELINFVLYQGNAPYQIEIIPAKPFSDAVIRPILPTIKTRIQDGRICFTVEKDGYFSVEPFGRNGALHLFIDPVRNYAATGNTLYFGPGEHHVGLIHMESDSTLFIDTGAVVYASIEAEDARNIRIIGNGILDNSENEAEILFPVEDTANDAAILNCVRKNAMTFHFCENLEIDGITIRDSLLYNIRPIGCKNIRIQNIKIIGCWRYNSDGIDMHNCENVTISHCFLRTFDDCICVKGWDFSMNESEMDHNGTRYDRARNYQITDCVLWNDWGRALEIGAETRSEEICNVTFENCHVIHVTHNVLDCQNVDYADVHDIRYKDISVEFDQIVQAPKLQRSADEKYVSDDPDFVPPLFESVVFYHPEYSAGGERRGKNHCVFVEDIHIFDAKKIIMHSIGFDEQHQSSQIVVRNIFLNEKKLHLPDEISVETNAFGHFEFEE